MCNSRTDYAETVCLYVFILLFNYISQGLNPGKAIAEIKKLLSGIAKKDAPGLNTAALQN
jgi:hypothetical protein